MPRTVWRDGEEAAWGTYRRRGYRLLARNWRCPLGELDLVVVRAGLVVFCEVKARATSRFGGPYESVNPRKQQKIRELAQAFIERREISAPRYRFDVASVLLDAHGRADVHLFEDAF